MKSIGFGCRLQGPKAIFEGLEKSLDGFDRRMDSRQIEITGEPKLEGNDLSLPWAVTYTLGDAPPYRLEASSKGTVENGRITYLCDIYSPEQEKKLGAWLKEHAPDIDPSYA